MLYLTLKKKRYSFPTSWREFTPAEAGMFRRMAREMNLYENGMVHFEYFRIALTIAILGLRNTKVPGLEGELAENLFRLSEQLSFPFAIHEGAEGESVCEMTVCLSDNLFPVLHGHRGYIFHYDQSGKVDCDITAERYVDCLSLMQAWQKSKVPTALESMVRTLYPGIRKVTPDDALAVYYNFRGILSWIRAIPAYRLLFTPSEGGDQGKKNPIGLASSIYSLSKAGYGPIESVKDLPLFDYLDILLQQSIESIRTLAASGMKPVQVAERLGLPTDLVLEYIQ